MTSSHQSLVFVNLSSAMPRMRRQNHSCDQCRKSKKACDGYALNQNRRQSMIDSSLSKDYLEPRPCSYCVRTKKICTLNKYWVGSDELPHSYSYSSLQTPVSSSTPSGPQPKSSQDASRVQLDSGALQAFLFDHQSGTESTLDFLQMPTPSQVSFPWQTPDSSIESSSNDYYPYHGLPGPMALGEEDIRTNLSQPGRDVSHLTFREELGGFEKGFIGADGRIEEDTPSELSGGSNTTIWGPSPSLSSAPAPVNPQMKASNTREHNRRRRLTQMISRQKVAESHSVSSHSIDHALASRSNSYLITESLLRIYHDVLENNLACWVTEDTCPYRMMRKAPCVEVTTAVAPEWGASWSNRMYRRVKQLDRVAQSQGLVRLTGTENRAASKALELAIMAFATQWSQGARRRDRLAAEEGDSHNDDDLRDRFEENLQQSVWEQAKQALQQVSHIESYRVVYAELIFGLINRPWGATTSPNTSPLCEGTSSTVSLLNQVRGILEDEGPPVCLERATRKIHAMKYALDAKASNNNLKYQENEPRGMKVPMDTQERGTIGLLYWLAVMFDTVSSTMNERPVTVPDEDCQHDQAAIEAASSPAQAVSARWKLNLYAQEDSAHPIPIRWPCSYEQATRAVARSAAVKVLLFRYVWYLQKAVRGARGGATVRDVVARIMTVYRYWNRTHGPFFQGLVRSYDAVPSRIKSWFPCIAIPWGLGCLMVADLMEEAILTATDEGEEEQMEGWTGIAAKIRRSSAVDLADLARVTTPALISDASPEQLSGLHFAVNEGPLLTEPWTVLLIRAFAGAAIFFFDEMDEGEQESAILGKDESLRETLERCELCVRALWFLGRKSEMARSLARVLNDELGRRMGTRG